MDFDRGKLFVGGISWETSEVTLNDHFNKYGEVVESVIIKDRITGNARGFGFVLFSDPSVADKALEDKHVILGRTVEVKRAIPRGEQYHNQNQNHHPHHAHHQQNKGFTKNSSNGDGTNNSQFRTKKIFVGGLSASLTEEEFKGYFEKFGRITDVVVMYDNTTQRPRGFGFITFDSEEAVENVMQKSFHELNDKLVEVKKAVPKDGCNSSNNVSYNNNYDNMRVDARRGSFFGSYQGGVYLPYDPRYGMYPGYAPMPFSGYANVGGYPYGPSVYGGYPYGGAGYGIAPYVAPRNTWNGPGMIDGRRTSVPYGNGAIYPNYMNGGVMGMAGGDYNGIMGPAANGKQSQGGGGDDAHIPAGTTPSRANGGKLDDDSSAPMGSYEAGGGEQYQRSPDGKFKPYPVDNSG